MQHKILLSQILNIQQGEMCKWKLRFNKHGNGISAKENYFGNKEGNHFDRMTLWCTQKSLLHKGEILIGLARLSHNKWLLVKIYEILDEDYTIKNSADRYTFKVLDEYSQFFGRVLLIVNSDRTLTYPVHSLANIERRKEYEVCEILNNEMEDNGFNGYDNVCLSFAELERIVNRQQQDWFNSLSNQKGVYLITDKHNGKLYVGSATAEKGMLFARWSNYVKNGHGGNKDLIKLVNEKGFNYVKENFQYSILENYNSKVDDNFILRRERFWKNILQSIEFGYNKN